MYPIRSCCLPVCLALLQPIFGLVPALAAPKTAHLPPAPAYRVVDLGQHRWVNQPAIPRDVAALLARRGVYGFSVRGVNRHGDRITNDDPDLPRQSYVWHGKKRYALARIPNVDFCEADAINDPGDIVGECWSDDDSYAAVLWHHGRVCELCALCPPPYRGSVPSMFGHGIAINNHGQIIALYLITGTDAEYYLLNPARTTGQRK